MLLVKTKIGPSKIHGIGLFADQYIRKGTIVWKYDCLLDRRIFDSTFDDFSEITQKYIRTYAYQHIDYFLLCGDDARFMNHSTTPNLSDVRAYGDEGEGFDVANCNIKVGTELTCNYMEFDADWDYGFKKKVKSKINKKEK